METETIQKREIKAVPKLRFKEFENEWEKKSLNTVAKIITGSTPPTQIAAYYNGDKLFVSPADIQSNRFIRKTKTTLTKAGFEKGREVKERSVLFVCIGSTIGKVGQALEKCITNQQINALEAKAVTSDDFIFSLLDYKGSKIKLLAGTQAVPQINKTDFSNLKFFFPKYPEQQKIASFLSAVDKKIQQFTRKKELLETYKKGVMQQLFSQEIRFTDEDGEDFPEWEEKRIGVLTKVTTGGTPQTMQQEYWGGNIRWMNSGELNLKVVFEVKNRITEEGLKNSATKLIPKKCILIGLAGQGKTRGTAAINMVELCTNQSIASIFPNYERFIPEYLFQNLDHRYSELRGLSTGDGGRGGLNLQIIKSFKIPLPSVEEQQNIADFLSAIDRKIETVQQQITKTQSFKIGLLQQMFV